MPGATFNELLTTFSAPTDGKKDQTRFGVVRHIFGNNEVQLPYYDQRCTDAHQPISILKAYPSNNAIYQKRNLSEVRHIERS